MKLLLILLIPMYALANCPKEDYGKKCNLVPCLTVTGPQVGMKSAFTCSKVYLKNKGDWKFDHYSIYQTACIKSESYTSCGAAEIKVIDIER